MRGSENLLDKPADELTEFLLRVARTDAAPDAARERALKSVASAALGIGVLSGTAALGSRTTLFKGTSWLVAKWLAAGMTSGLLSIGAVQGIAQLAAPSSARLEAPHGPSTRAAASPARFTPRAVSLAPAMPAAEPAEPAPAMPAAEPAAEPAEPGPTPELAPVPALPSQATASARSAVNAPRATPSHEPRSASPPASVVSSVTAPLASRTSSLTRELSLLEQARTALTNHSPSGALQALAEYRAEFPHGSLQVEAAALRVEAVEQSGNPALARKLAQSFLANFPNSPLAARVRAFSDVLVPDAQKP
jgi:hypothetical protein